MPPLVLLCALEFGTHVNGACKLDIPHIPLLYRKKKPNMEDALPLTGLKFVKGDPVALERGKVFVLEFWATWCG